MLNSQKISNWKYTLLRVLLFCFCCAIALIAASILTKNLPVELSQHLLAVIAIIITCIFTLLFVRWEGLRLNDIGVLPSKNTFSRLLIGLVIGIVMVLIHSGLVLFFGGVKLIYNYQINASLIASNFLLYLLIACREEIAFRGYPLRSLAYAIGPFGAQLIIAVIFALEHVASGVTWIHAFSGAGLGAIFVGATIGYLSGKQVVNNYHRYAKIQDTEAKDRRKKRNRFSFNLNYTQFGMQPGVVYQTN